MENETFFVVFFNQLGYDKISWNFYPLPWKSKSKSFYQNRTGMKLSLFFNVNLATYRFYVPRVAIFAA